jgi:hypothetical protein
VTYLKPKPRSNFDPKADVFELHREFVVAITRIKLHIRPYIRDPGELDKRIRRLSDYCRDKLGIQNN